MGCLWFPIDAFNVLVKFHFLGNSTPFEGFFDDLLFIGWKKDVTASAHEIGIATEVENQSVHELGILVGVHPLLEVGEPFGKYHGLVVGVVRTVILLSAFRGINQSQIHPQFCLTAECQLTEAGLCLRTVSVQTEGIVCRNVVINLLHITKFVFISALNVQPKVQIIIESLRF